MSVQYAPKSLENFLLDSITLAVVSRIPRPRPLELLSSASVVEGLGAESIAHLYIAKHETKEGERKKVYFIECPNSCWRIWYGPQLHGFVVL